MLGWRNSYQKVAIIYSGLLLFSGCEAMDTSLNTDNFAYDYDGVVCPGTSITADTLFQSVSKNIVSYVANDEELKAAIGVVSFQKPTLSGYKHAGDRHLVQYLFGSFVRHDIVLPGEGGVSILVDGCEKAILSGSFFNLPN